MAPPGSLAARLAGSGQALFAAATGLKGAGASQILALANGRASIGGVLGGAVLMQAFASFWSWLTADYDGPVAVDQISGPRYVLDAWTDNARKSIEVSGRTYSGLNGSSNYELSWSLRHSRTWAPVADTKWLGRGAYGLVAAYKFTRFAPFRCIVTVNGQQTSFQAFDVLIASGGYSSLKARCRVQNQPRALQAETTMIPVTSLS